MDFATSNIDFTFDHVPTKMNMQGNSQLKSFMADYEKESSLMLERNAIQNIHEPLPFSSLGFSTNLPNNTPTTLADILGKIDETVFDQPEAQPQADALISSFDLNPLPPLPVESSTPVQEFSEVIQSIDDVIECFGGRTNNNNNNNNNNNDWSLEPIPLVRYQDMKRGLELSSLEQGPAAKKQKKATESEDDSNNFFRSYQAEQWTQRFEELCNYCQEHGHCQVPHTFTTNPALARWVKRQRYQYKLRLENKPSAMTDERISVLEKIGFVWDSHVAAWEERRNELMEYKKAFGHCNVPSNYSENRQLAIWVKRQRRQYKFFWEGKQSSMTKERIAALESVGFEWELRVRESKN